MIVGLVLSVFFEVLIFGDVLGDDLFVFIVVE